MRYVLTLLLLTIAFSSAVMAEEKADFKSLYKALSDVPTQEEEAEFAKSLAGLVHPTVQSDADFSAAPLKTALAFLGIEGCDRSFLGNITEAVFTDTKVTPPPYKVWVMLGALFRCALSIKPEPADERTQLLAASAIRTHINFWTLYDLRYTAGDDGLRYKEYCRSLVSIASEFDFENRYDALIDGIAAKLPYGVEDKWTGLDEWAKAVDSRSLNMIELAAHLQWLYRTFTLEECIREEIPESVDRKTAWYIGKMILLIANPRYMTAAEEEIESSGGSCFGTPSLFLRTIRIADLVIRVHNNSNVGSRNKIGGTNNLLFAPSGCFNFTYYASNPYRSLLQEWKDKSIEGLYWRGKHNDVGCCKLEKVATGTSGHAWFMGAQKLAYGVPCDVKNDYIYPHVYAECYGDRKGFDWIIGLYSEMFRHRLLAQVEGYIWNASKQGREACSLTDSIEVNAKLLCDPENEFEALMSEPWRKTFVKGLVGVNPSALSPVTVPTMFDPAAFYYCDKTTYTIYEFWDNDHVIGEIIGKRPICVLSIRPAADAKVIETKAGLVSNVLNHWYLNSMDIPTKIKSWHLVTFRESQKPLFDEVSARNAKIRSTFDEDYNKSFEKYDKKKAEILGPMKP